MMYSVVQIQWQSFLSLSPNKTSRERDNQVHFRCPAFAFLLLLRFHNTHFICASLSALLPSGLQNPFPPLNVSCHRHNSLSEHASPRLLHDAPGQFHCLPSLTHPIYLSVQSGGFVPKCIHSPAHSISIYWVPIKDEAYVKHCDK